MWGPSAFIASRAGRVRGAPGRPGLAGAPRLGGFGGPARLGLINAPEFPRFVGQRAVPVGHLFARDMKLRLQSEKLTFDFLSQVFVLQPHLDVLDVALHVLDEHHVDEQVDAG